MSKDCPNGFRRLWLQSFLSRSAKVDADPMFDIRWQGMPPRSPTKGHCIHIPKSLLSVACLMSFQCFKLCCDPKTITLTLFDVLNHWKISESPPMKCQCVDSRYPRMWGQGKLQTSPTSSCQGSWNGKASYHLDRLGELRGGSFPKLLN